MMNYLEIGDKRFCRDNIKIEVYKGKVIFRVCVSDAGNEFKVDRKALQRLLRLSAR